MGGSGKTGLERPGREGRLARPSQRLGRFGEPVHLRPPLSAAALEAQAVRETIRTRLEPWMPAGRGLAEGQPPEVVASMLADAIELHHLKPALKGQPPLLADAIEYAQRLGPAYLVGLDAALAPKLAGLPDFDATLARLDARLETLGLSRAERAEERRHLLYLVFETGLNPVNVDRLRHLLRDGVGWTSFDGYSVYGSGMAQQVQQTAQDVFDHPVESAAVVAGSALASPLLGPVVAESLPALMSVGGVVYGLKSGVQVLEAHEAEAHGDPDAAFRATYAAGQDGATAAALVLSGRLAKSKRPSQRPAARELEPAPILKPQPLEISGRSTAAPALSPQPQPTSRASPPDPNGLSGAATNAAGSHVAASTVGVYESTSAESLLGKRVWQLVGALDQATRRKKPIDVELLNGLTDAELATRPLNSDALIRLLLKVVTDVDPATHGPLYARAMHMLETLPRLELGSWLTDDQLRYALIRHAQRPDVLDRLLALAERIRPGRDTWLQEAATQARLDEMARANPSYYRQGLVLFVR